MSIFVAVLSAIIAVTSIVWQAISESRRQQREQAFLTQQKEADRRAEAEQLVRRYREPIIFAADQLVNRVENVRAKGFLEKYGVDRREYVVNSTVYAVAELLGWMELLRQDQQFLDLGEEGATRRMNECLAAIGRSLSTDTIIDADGRPALVMIWRQEQRAIGEVMIERATGQGARCLGYASFNQRLGDPLFAQWFDRLVDDVEHIIDEPARGLPRLVEVSAAACALIDHLDPDHVRVQR
ncbi:MAG: hypothetical protein AB7Q42_07930 [Acidimicrobiia bacterium]